MGQSANINIYIIAKTEDGLKAAKEALQQAVIKNAKERAQLNLDCYEGVETVFSEGDYAYKRDTDSDGAYLSEVCKWCHRAYIVALFIKAIDDGIISDEYVVFCESLYDVDIDYYCGLGVEPRFTLFKDKEANEWLRADYHQPSQERV